MNEAFHQTSALVDPVAIAVCALTALSVGAVGWAFLAPFGKLASLPKDAPSNEAERRSGISEKNPIYAKLQPLVVDLAIMNRSLMNPGSREKLRKSLLVSEEGVVWQPEEYVAVKQVESLSIGSVVGMISLVTVPWTFALGIVVFASLIYVMVSLAGVQEKAAKRLRSLKVRLPFAVDLMALMIEAGATFRDGLVTLVRENKGHPLGEELSRVDRQIELGRPRADALRSMQDRVEDEDVTELVFAINKGEELGTPLATILRNQADQMRLKRSQWGEKAAAEAEVKMAFPGMVVMFACMLVILAPIMLPALRTLRGE